MGHALYDLVHPDDKDKIREQLSLHDNQSPGMMNNFRFIYVPLWKLDDYVIVNWTVIRPQSKTQRSLWNQAGKGTYIMTQT